MTGMALATARCHAAQPAAEDVGAVGGGVVEAHLGQVPGEPGQPSRANASGIGGDHHESDFLGLLGTDGAEVVGGGLSVEHVGL